MNIIKKGILTLTVACNVLFSSALMAITLNELNNPISVVFDITQDVVSHTGINVSKIMQDVDKITVAVDKITSTFPREVTIYSCPTDTYNNTYCPKNLSVASSFWEYYDGSSEEHVTSVIDLESGVAIPHGGTVTDYMSASQSSTNCNYVATSTTVEVGCNYPAVVNNSSCPVGTIANPTTGLCYDGGHGLQNQASAISICADLGMRLPTLGETSAQIANGIPSYSGWTWTSTQYPGYSYRRWSGTSIYIYGGYPSDLNYVRCVGSTASTYTCPYGGTLSETTCERTCSSTTYDSSYVCPSGMIYNSATGLCYDGGHGLQNQASADSTCSGINKRLPTFNETAAKTPNGIPSYGGWTWTSTQYPGYSHIRWKGTSQYPYGGYASDVNYVRCVSLPVSGNGCPSGGTLSGTTCIKTCVDMSCSSGYSLAGSVCKKDINFNYYEYDCSAGYTTDNHGINIYTKTDSDTSTNNQATLNDDANSPTPPNGNCQRSLPYKFYKYLCDTTPSYQGTEYEAINEGLSSCDKVDSSSVTREPSLSDNCNSNIPPVNNCKRKIFNCNSLREPALVAGTWMCSPFICDPKKQCASAECVNGTPVQGGTSYDNSPLVGENTSVVCNDNPWCDAVLYENLGRCGMPPKCPTAFGVYKKNGDCYQDVCPPEATEKDIGNGQTSCLSLQCPTGYLENASGECDAQ